VNNILRYGLGALLVVEAVGTWAFCFIYLTRSDWRSTAVGRHLATYGITLGALYVVTLASLIWRGHYLLYGGVLIAHAAFGAAIWQRFYLVRKEQRPPHDDRSR
jgi:hypothetical protein